MNINKIYCEWKQLEYGYKVGCLIDEYSFIVKEWKFCPYCGRELEQDYTD